MSQKVYANDLKRRICHKICDQKQSRSKVAEEYQVPLKTVENWITAYYRDKHVFDRPDDYISNQYKRRRIRYDYMSEEEMIQELKRKDTMIQYLKSLVIAYSKDEENNRLHIGGLQI